MTESLIGYEFWHLYWPDEKVQFKVAENMRDDWYLCIPIDDDPEVDEIVLKESQLRYHQRLDQMFGK